MDLKKALLYILPWAHSLTHRPTDPQKYSIKTTAL